MNERDYLRLKRQFTEEFETKLRALELIWLEASGGKKPPKQPIDVNGASAERGNSAAAVAEFVSQWNGEPFSAKQVEAWITQVKGLSANRTTIIHKLRRLVNEGRLDLTAKGSGKRASLYAIPSRPAVVPKADSPAQADRATETEIEELRQLLISQSIDIPTFKKDVIQGELGLARANDLTRSQVQELILRYTPLPF